MLEFGFPAVFFPATYEFVYFLFKYLSSYDRIIQKSKQKIGVLCNQIGFVNSPLTVSGASFLSSLYMQICNY